MTLRSAEVTPVQNLTIPNAYTQWLNRLKRFLAVYRKGLITGKELDKYQLYLLNTGQFNANFTLAELERLNYPRSPFAMMHAHTYLRATETWSMEIMRILYQEKYPQRLFPIWVDSILFWHELRRYCRVIDEKEIGNHIASLYQELNANGGYLNTNIWIKLNKTDNVDILTHKKRIEQEIRSNIFRLVIQAQNNGILLPLLNEVRAGNSVKAFPQSTELLDQLETLFPQVKRDALLQLPTLRAELNLPGNLENAEISWYGKVFSKAKLHRLLIPQVKNPQALKAWAIDNPQPFAEMLAIIQERLGEERPSVSAYVELLKQWIAENVNPVINTFDQKTIYFFPDNFKDMEALVLCDCATVPEDVNSLMGNIGYRIDPVRIQRVVLREFPGLFIDQATTLAFFQRFTTTTMLSKLPSEERNNLEAVFAATILQIQTTPNNNNILPISFLKELEQLKSLTSKLEPNFKIYASFILDYLNELIRLYPQKSAIRLVVDAEVKETLAQFLHACQRNDLAMAIRCSQTIAEILLLDLEYRPMQEKVSTIVSKNLLQNFPVQGVMTTPYAMRAFTRVLQLLDTQYVNRPCHIAVTNQSYFELLHNLERLNTRHIAASLVRHLTNIDPNADIIYIEIHPNNVVETKQFAHDVHGLLTCLKSTQWPLKPRTLVVDVTLNALNDSEITGFLNAARPLIESGYLNIILIQSGTKFLGRGLDVRSLGILTVINNGTHEWLAVNRQIVAFNQHEIVDESTIDFFSYFINQRSAAANYIQLINRNVHFVYTTILRLLNQLEVAQHSRLQITMSSDARACYVALNLTGLLPEVDDGFKSSVDKIEEFSADVLKYLIHPLCLLYRLPLTERVSIGFPLTSVNIVFDSLRFTIGLEDDEQLKQYAEILAYAAFVINRHHEPKLFFDLNADKQYELRHRYLKEKTQQYTAMTPGANRELSFEFEANGSENSYHNQTTQTTRQMKRRVRIKNGHVAVDREVSRDAYGHTEFRPYRVEIPLRGVGRVLLTDPRVSLSMRRMSVSCLTRIARAGQPIYHHVNSVFDNCDGVVSLASMEMLGSWNSALVYGPFTLNQQRKIYFYLYQMRIELFINDRKFSEDAIMIKQGHMRIPLSRMGIDDREFLIREGIYERDRSIFRFPNQVSRFDMLHIPDCYDPTRFSIEDDKLVIERDFIYCTYPGVTVYKRYMGREFTCFEIDMWGVKDPNLARFMRLMTAVYIKDKKQVGFLARDKNFTHFLFNLANQGDEGLFLEAVTYVLKKKHMLNNLLQRYQEETHVEDSQQYPFQTDKRFNWPSGNGGQSYTGDRQLIVEALALLKQLIIELAPLPVLPTCLPQSIAPGSAQTASQLGTFPVPRTSVPLQIGSISPAVHEPGQRPNMSS